MTYDGPVRVFSGVLGFVVALAACGGSDGGEGGFGGGGGEGGSAGAGASGAAGGSGGSGAAGGSGGSGASSSGGSQSGGSSGSQSGGSGGSGGSSGGCQNSLDCGVGEVCDTSRGDCVECVRDQDCPDNLLCTANQCTNACDSDNDCTPFGLLCDVGLGRCYDPGGSGGNGGSGGSSQGGSSGSGGSGGFGGGGSGGTGPVGCNGDVMILLDRSASMQDMGLWQYVVDGINDFTGRNVAGRWGLQRFPMPWTTDPMLPPTCMTIDDCGDYGPCQPIFNQCAGNIAGSSTDDSCTVSDYRTPLVQLGSMSQNASSFLSKIAGLMPDGAFTPSSPAMWGVYDYLDTAVPASRVGRLVLITDGDPTGCSVNRIDTMVALAEQALQQGVRTDVITAGGNISTLNPVAQAGGTGSVKAVTSALQLENQLVNIGAELGCSPQ